MSAVHVLVFRFVSKQLGRPTTVGQGERGRYMKAPPRLMHAIPRPPDET